MKRANFFLNVDMVGNFIFFIAWFFYPKILLSYNFELKKYDDLHLHFARILGITLFANGVLSYYALKKNCPVTKSKILSIKLMGYIAVLFTMVIDNLSSGVMGDKHMSFGIFGLTLLIINAYLGLRSLKKYIRKQLDDKKNKSK